MTALDAPMKHCYFYPRNDRANEQNDMISELINRLLRRRIQTPRDVAHAELERRRQAHQDAPVLHACRANNLSPGQTRRVLAAFHANIAPLGLLAARQGACDLASSLAKKSAAKRQADVGAPPWA